MTKHPPTAQQQQRARRRGDVAYGEALQAAVAVWVVGGWALWMGQGWVTRWREGLREGLRGAQEGGAAASSGPEGMAQAWMGWAQWLAWQAGWLLLVVVIVGAVVAGLQVGGVVKGRGGGAAGHGRGEGAAQGVYRLVGWGGLMAYGVWCWRGVLAAVLATAGGEVSLIATGGVALTGLWGQEVDAVGATLMAAAAFAVGDRVLAQWLRWRRLHMTAAQARVDASEGAPNQAIRQRLRQVTQASAAEESAGSGLATARRAVATDWGAVVIAISDMCRGQCVCLSYQPPLVDPPHLAKIAQTDEEAQAMLAMIALRQVVVVDEPPLLRQLLYGCSLGDPIPQALFARVGALMGMAGSGDGRGVGHQDV